MATDLWGSVFAVKGGRGERTAPRLFLRPGAKKSALERSRELYEFRHAYQAKIPRYFVTFRFGPLRPDMSGFRRLDLCCLRRRFRRGKAHLSEVSAAADSGACASAASGYRKRQNERRAMQIAAGRPGSNPWTSRRTHAEQPGPFSDQAGVFEPATRKPMSTATRTCRMTFAELNERSNRIANAFRRGRCRAKGERVGLLLMNSAEFMEAYFGLAKIGAVVVPLNWRLVADELEFILKDSGTTRLIFGEEFIDTVADLHGRGEKTDIRTMAAGGRRIGRCLVRRELSAVPRCGGRGGTGSRRRGRGHALHHVYLRYHRFAEGGGAHPQHLDLGHPYHRRELSLPGGRKVSGRITHVPRRRPHPLCGQRLPGRHLRGLAQFRAVAGLAVAGARKDHHRADGAGHAELHAAGSRLRKVRPFPRCAGS